MTIASEVVRSIGDNVGNKGYVPEAALPGGQSLFCMGVVHPEQDAMTARAQQSRCELPITGDRLGP